MNTVAMGSSEMGSFDEHDNMMKCLPMRSHHLSDYNLMLLTIQDIVKLQCVW